MTHEEKVMNTCIYFNGMLNKTCDAGVVYDDTDRGMQVVYRANMPCHKICKYRTVPWSADHCPKAEFPDIAKAEAKVAEMDEVVARMEKALEAVAPLRRKYKGQDYNGVIDCPICAGKLHFRHAKYNGHIHARCETENCVSWME